MLGQSVFFNWTVEGRIVGYVLLGWGACFEVQMQVEGLACEFRGWGIWPLL